jgi:hypothetical protein
MSRSTLVLALTAGFALGAAGTARAGAPQPDTRQGDYVHICQGGPNKGLTCSVATEPVDCPNSAGVVQAQSKSIKGVLTMIAHDSVTDWVTGTATHRAVTMLLEVKAPDGSRQLLAATYQDLADPTQPPSAPSDVIAIPMDEQALVTLAKAPGGLLFARPEESLTAQLRQLFGNDGTPVLIDADERRPQGADHTGDALATVLRFKVRIMFVDPA